MDTLINDIMGPPRRRSRNPTKSPHHETPPIQRKSGNDPSKNTLDIPLQVTVPKKTLPGSFDNGPATPGPNVVSELATPTEIPLPPKNPSEIRALEEAASSDIPAPAELPSMGGPAQVEDTGELLAGKGVAEIKERPTTQELPTDGGTNQGEEAAVQAEETSTTKVLPLDEDMTQDNQGTVREDRSFPSFTVLEPTPVVYKHETILIGIAGATASGKTLLSRFLSLVLPPTTAHFSICQNDFFVPKHFLIPSKSGKVDTDCAEAIDSAAFLRVLKYAKREGRLPPGYSSEYNGDAEQDVAKSLIAHNVVDEIKRMLADSGSLPEGQAVCFVTGFLLYHDAGVRDILDIKFFLRATKEASKIKRFEKPTCAAKHDFWRTQRYFDKIVWPNYVRDHKPLFKNGDVESTPLFDLCDSLGISMQPQQDMSGEQILRWAAGSIPPALQGSHEHIPKLTRGLDADGAPDPEVYLRRRYEVCECSDGWLGHLRKVLFDFV